MIIVVMVGMQNTLIFLFILYFHLLPIRPWVWNYAKYKLSGRKGYVRVLQALLVRRNYVIVQEDELVGDDRDDEPDGNEDGNKDIGQAHRLFSHRMS